MINRIPERCSSPLKFVGTLRMRHALGHAGY